MRHNMPIRSNCIDNRQTFESGGTAGNTTAIGKPRRHYAEAPCLRSRHRKELPTRNRLPLHECLLQERRSAGGVIPVNNRWQTGKTRGDRRFDLAGNNRQGKIRGRKSGEIIEKKLTRRIVGRIILEGVLMTIRCRTVNMFQRIGKCHLLRKQQKQRQPDT